MNYPIPKSSSKAWLAHKAASPQNPSLIFDRFVQNWGYTQGKDSEAKKKAWEEIVEVAQKADKNLLQQWNIRWEATVRAAGAETFTMKTGWRFMAGLGSKGSLEVGFAFHRYGFPILPGSSVKGIARAWGLCTVAESLAATSQLEKLDCVLAIDEEEKFNKEFAKVFSQPGDEAAKLAKNFRTIFGTPGCSGRGVFFDAIPQGHPQLELDVMNPHYSEYYQDKLGKNPPANWLSPVPIYFLTVAKDCEFTFAVGWRTLRAGNEVDELHLIAKEWLNAGLKNLGAGAKTSAGYGYFMDPEEAKLNKALPSKDQVISIVSLSACGNPTGVDPDEAAADQIIAEIQHLKTTAVAGSIRNFYQKWQNTNISPAQKRRVAEAIITKVKEAGREKQSLDKDWYKDLRLYLEEN